MKKFLSLVLALVMTMSLVTVSAGAVDFTDDSDIDYEEAVDVISALGIVDGYSDDSFRPDGSLTRGAAAKIICNLILGPTTASALSATTAPFRDVPTTNTFAGYITYCSQQGIISGYGDGTFRPTGSLTGNAFLKMLLGALGYDSSIEGYTGANWQVNVIKQAVGIGLDDGNDNFVGSQTVTRQEAALYAFNMIQANLVQYDSKTTVNVNGATVTVAGDKAENIPQNGSGYDNSMNDGIQPDESDAVVQFAERYFPRLSRIGRGHDDMGRPSVEWRYRTEIIGEYPDTSTLKGTWTSSVSKDELYDLVGSTVVNMLKATPSKVTVWVNGDDTTLATPAQVEDYFLRNASGAVGNAVNGVGQAGNGVVTELYMDDNNDVTIVMANTYLLRATADYNEARESVSVETVQLNTGMPAFPATIDQEDFDVSGVNEGDYLLVTWSEDAQSIQSVEVAEVVTGTVSEYTERDNVIVDGEKYSYNKLLSDEMKSEEFSINSEAAVVMDGYGYIIYVDEAVANSSYVYIEQFGSTSSLSVTALAKAYFTDGTYDEIEVNKVDNVDRQATIAGYGLSDTYCKWYTFTVNSDGSYNLMSTRAPRRAYDATYNTANNSGSFRAIVQNDKVQFLANVGNDDVYGDEDTIFVLVDAEDTVKAYTGVANAPTVSIANGVAAGRAKIAWVEDESHYAKFVFIDLNGLNDYEVTVDDSTEDTVIFVLKDNNKRTVVAGTEYYQYTVVDTDGTINTAKYFDSYMDCETGNLYTNIRTNSNGYVTGGDVVGTTSASDQEEFALNGTITLSQSGRTMKFSNGNNYVIPSDASVNLVIGKGVTELLKNDDADYETYLNTTPGTIGGMLQGYDLTGHVFAIVEDAGSDVVSTLYVYITAVDDHDPDRAGKPVVTISGTKSYVLGETATALTADATVPSGKLGSFSYKWYEINAAGEKVGTDLTTMQTYTPVITSIGSKTYRCEVTNTVDATHSTIGYADVTVTVGAAAVKSIAVTTMPTKYTGYVAGEAFDPSGMVVTATYTDNTTGVIPVDKLTFEVDLSSYDPTKTVTVKYGEAKDEIVIGMTARTAQTFVNNQTNLSLTMTKNASGDTVYEGTLAVSVNAGGEVGTTPTITVKRDNTTNNNVKAEYSDGQLTITVLQAFNPTAASGAPVIITVAGTSENGSTPAADATITLTVNPAT